MITKNLKRNLTLLLCVASIALLIGCGSGGSGALSDSASSINGTISGTAIKGPVADALIKAFSVNSNGSKGEHIGSGVTDTQGNFSVSIGDHSGPVLMEMTGGHYMDEATGVDMDMLQGDKMICAIPSFQAGLTMNGIHITPLTSMAQNMAQNMSGGMTESNITIANNAIGRYFDVDDILQSHPIDPIVADDNIGAGQDMINYGMIMAAMSQFAQMVGMTHSYGIVTNFMNDASDGHMNGMMGNSQLVMGGGMMGGGMMMPANSGTGMLSAAMEEFIQSPMNKSGITMTEMEALINKLNSSSGIIQ